MHVQTIVQIREIFTDLTPNQHQRLKTKRPEIYGRRDTLMEAIMTKKRIKLTTVQRE